MTLEEQIKELQKQLALKKAFASVQFLWDEAIDPEILQLVEHKLREAAHLLANDLTATSSKVVVDQPKSQFTEQEVVALKTLAQSVLNRSQNAELGSRMSDVPEKQVTPRQASEPSKSGNRKAMLLYTDNVPKHYRSSVSADTEVEVIEQYANKTKVSDGKGNVFLIPHDDIEFID